MNASQVDQLKAVVGWIFAAGFMFLGILFLALGGYEFWEGSKTKDWPAAPGRMIESAIETRSSSSRPHGRSSRRDTDYSVRVRYSYEVAGQKLEGQRLQYGNKSHDKQSSAKQVQSLYPAGKEVQVFYDPKNLKSSVLLKGSGATWLAMGLGSMALVLGSATMVHMARARRAGTGDNMPSS
jgi:hypothetical protein